jgi:hypothetical protein
MAWHVAGWVERRVSGWMAWRIARWIEERVAGEIS